MTHAWMETVLEFPPVRAFAAFALLCRAYLNEWRGRAFRSLDDFCRVVRLSESSWMSSVAMKRVLAVAEQAMSGKRNPVVDAYRADSSSAQLAAIFTIGPPSRA